MNYLLNDEQRRWALVTFICDEFETRGVIPTISFLSEKFNVSESIIQKNLEESLLLISSDDLIDIIEEILYT